MPLNNKFYNLIQYELCTMNLEEAKKDDIFAGMGMEEHITIIWPNLRTEADNNELDISDIRSTFDDMQENKEYNGLRLFAMFDEGDNQVVRTWKPDELDILIGDDGFDDEGNNIGDDEGAQKMLINLKKEIKIFNNKIQDGEI